MFYLILSVLSTAFISIVFKIAQAKNISPEPVILISYMVCLVVSLITFLQSGLLVEMTGCSLQNTWRAAATCFQGIPNFAGSILLTALFGLVSGPLYPLGMLFQQHSIEKAGASLTSMFTSTAFIIPLLLSILLWNEFPVAYQWVGIIGVVVALILSSFSRQKGKLHSILLYQLLLMGCSNFLIKLYSVYTLSDLIPLYYLVIFLTALIIYAMYFKKTNCSFKQSSPLLIFCGILMGLANISTSFFTQNALRLLPANIVYPTTGAAGMILITAVSIVFFREKLRTNQIVAILLSAISIILVNLKA